MPLCIICGQPFKKRSGSQKVCLKETCRKTQDLSTNRRWQIKKIIDELHKGFKKYKKRQLLKQLKLNHQRYEENFNRLTKNPQEKKYIIRENNLNKECIKLQRLLKTSYEGDPCSGRECKTRCYSTIRRNQCELIDEIRDD